MLAKDIKELVKRIKNFYQSSDPLEIIKKRKIIHSFLGDSSLCKSSVEGMDGIYFESQGVKFILINPDLDDHRAKIAYASNLGHAILHPDVNIFSLKDVTGYNIEKYIKEADIFAAELLLDDYIF
ncbi:ImmA/IrrE family metallo-endopeptidase [Romboutsia weinsteinii]|uniref:ImmA/IrrE family metallo-endopeptidase n=1 Tax=Romboutsia weinsteinii TaxID=2020949 RepID=A0A371J203_9FIRM|nr:ImmA/IrrE family metallo-endopeptidase [Romboutsia weinsteinii]RDY26713.1 ImmA/IrrE family metallo-endopeptidase [Romboutsia weinsteinii]